MTTVICVKLANLKREKLSLNPTYGYRLILKLMCKFKKTIIAQTIFKNKNNVERLNIAYFKTDCKSSIARFCGTDIEYTYRHKPVEYN